MDDSRVEMFKEALERLRSGDFRVDLPGEASDEVGRLELAINQLAAQLEAESEELQRLNNIKTTFIGVAAHDMRNPLGLIITSTQLLLKFEKSMDDLERRELLQGILDAARHMLELISDLLDVSQIESGKIDLYFEMIQVNDFLNEIVRLQSRLAAEKGTLLQLEVSEGEEMWADRMRIRQVIDNLVSNAIKFSPHDSQIVITAQWRVSDWLFQVKDQGPGINQKDRDKLFKPFGQLSARPTGKEKSTGLGLAISRWIVDAHHGEIGVDSEPGEGSTFWFTIPSKSEDV
jgi:signal transduction histidine kinase